MWGVALFLSFPREEPLYIFPLQTVLVLNLGPEVLSPLELCSGSACRQVPMASEKSCRSPAKWQSWVVQGSHLLPTLCRY